MTVPAQTCSYIKPLAIASLRRAYACYSRTALQQPNTAAIAAAEYMTGIQKKGGENEFAGNAIVIRHRYCFRHRHEKMRFGLERKIKIVKIVKLKELE